MKDLLKFYRGIYILCSFVIGKDEMSLYREPSLSVRCDRIGFEHDNHPRQLPRRLRKGR